MSSFRVEVDADEFYTWSSKALAKLETMVNTLREINSIIYHTTAPLTPLDKGYLMDSIFSHSVIVSEYPMYSLKIEMTGIDNPTARGWDYALIQYLHEFHHPVQGESFYLKKGFDEAKPYIWSYLETDYLSALGL